MILYRDNLMEAWDEAYRLLFLFPHPDVWVLWGSPAASCEPRSACWAVFQPHRLLLFLQGKINAETKMIRRNIL